MLSPADPPTLLERGRMLWRFARPRSGWMFTNARFLAARVELDPARVSRVLPFGLRPSTPAQATLFVAHFPTTSFESVYSEAGIFVHLAGGAQHCPWILVDDDVALITGRELLGYPKKIGSIDFTLSGDRAHARVERKGARVFEVHAELGEIDPTPPPMEGRRTLNVLGSIGWSLQRLIAFTPEEEILEARHATVDLRLFHAPRDPLHELGIGRVTSAHYYRVNLGGRSLPWPVLPVGPRFWIHNWSLRSR